MQEYLISLNATDAYRKAGYQAKGNAAESGASRLLRNAKVQAAIQAARAQCAQTAQQDGVTPERIIRGLAAIAFADRRKLAEWGPNGIVWHPSAELTEDEASIVESFSQTTSESGGSMKLTTASRLGAYKLLMQHLGMLKELGSKENPLQVEQVVFYVPANNRETSPADQATEGATGAIPIQ